MNFIKPEDIKEYMTKNPTGIAGMSKELSEMVNHFVELSVRECSDYAHKCIIENSNEYPTKSVAYRIKQHFGVEE